MGINSTSSKKTRRERHLSKQTKPKLPRPSRQSAQTTESEEPTFTTQPVELAQAVQAEADRKQITLPLEPASSPPAHYLIPVPEDEEPSPFSTFLRLILKQDNIHVPSFAYDLGVAENTLYRWLNGSSVPRTDHLKKLLVLLPEHYTKLAYAIEQTFPGSVEALPTGIREVHKDIYLAILDLVSTSADPNSRYWNIVRVLFEHALLHLDSEYAGLAITFARVMRAPDGYIHTLYEAEMYGHYPWPYMLIERGYLGSTTLAGAAAMRQQTYSWDELTASERLQFIRDEFEQSACAHPVLRTGRIAGALVISSTQASFFANPVRRKTVIEYAQLLALGLSDDDFYEPSQIQLRPMPALKFQRAKISEVSKHRIAAYANGQGLPRPKAEKRVREEMALEFEELANPASEQQKLPVEHR